MRIEQARDRHFDEIAALLLRHGLPTAGLRDQFPAAYVVAVDGETVTGCAGLEVYGTVGLLRSVAVDPARLSTGIGRALVADRLAAAARQRLGAVYVLTTTAADFFAHVGFVGTDRGSVPPSLASSPEFASACPASAVCLKRAV